VAWVNHDTIDRNDNIGVDDLVAHFENFNMEDLGVTGSPMLQRSMTERNNFTPQPRNDQVKQDYGNQDPTHLQGLKDDLDAKKVRLLELETENGELKALIEQMTREVQGLRE